MSDNTRTKQIPYYYNPKNGMFRLTKIHTLAEEPDWGTLYDMPEDDQEALATLVLVSQEQNVNSFIGGRYLNFPTGEIGKSSAFEEEEEEGLLYIRVYKYV